jgi:DNA-binding NarL/FixJ family response regulator
MAAVDRHSPDVVLMDLRMPRTDGITATRRVRSRQNPPEVIVLTTFDADENVVGALRAGASGFLLKDTPPGEMIAGVRTVAAGNALLAPEVTRGLIGRFGARIRDADSGVDKRIEEALADLTAREVEVLRLISAGLSNSEIAEALFLGRETVKTYVSRIFAKLDLRDRVQAVVFAYRIGLVAPDAG